MKHPLCPIPAPSRHPLAPEVRHGEGDGSLLMRVAELDLEVSFLPGSAFSGEQLQGGGRPGALGLDRWLPERKQRAHLGLHESTEEMTSLGAFPPTPRRPLPGSHAPHTAHPIPSAAQDTGQQGCLHTAGGWAGATIELQNQVGEQTVCLPQLQLHPHVRHGHGQREGQAVLLGNVLKAGWRQSLQQPGHWTCSNT